MSAKRRDRPRPFLAVEGGQRGLLLDGEAGGDSAGGDIRATLTGEAGGDSNATGIED